MNKNLESFKTFMKQREMAANAYVNGDPVPVADITTNNSPATFFSPGGGFQQGAEDVLSEFNQGTAMFDAGGDSNFEIMDMAASDSIAYWVGIQRATAYIKGNKDPIPMNLRVTEIFRFEDSGWKLVHRHADFLVTASSQS